MQHSSHCVVSVWLGTRVVVCALLSVAAYECHAQTTLDRRSEPPTAEVPSSVRQAVMKKTPGVWVEGPGYQITYGRTYELCAQQCLAANRCRMIEFYRPEKKCNLYDSVRPQLKGGDSTVGIRQ